MRILSARHRLPIRQQLDFDIVAGGKEYKKPSAVSHRPSALRQRIWRLGHLTALFDFPMSTVLRFQDEIVRFDNITLRLYYCGMGSRIYR